MVTALCTHFSSFWVKKYVKLNVCWWAAAGGRAWARAHTGGWASPAQGYKQWLSWPWLACWWWSTSRLSLLFFLMLFPKQQGARHQSETSPLPAAHKGGRTHAAIRALRSQGWQWLRRVQSRHRHTRVQQGRSVQRARSEGGRGTVSLSLWVLSSCFSCLKAFKSHFINFCLKLQLLKGVHFHTFNLCINHAKKIIVSISSFFSWKHWGSSLIYFKIFILYYSWWTVLY